MAHKDTNKKIHKDAINRDKIDPKYGYVSGEWHEGGSHHFRYENATEPEKFFEQKVDVAGNYKHTAFDDKDKAHVGELKVGEVRSYIGGGSSQQVDSHWDFNGEITGRIEILHDMGRAIGGDYHDAVKGQRKSITKGGEYQGQAGSSITVQHQSHKSTKTRHGSGDDWHYIEKNHGHYVSKSSVQYTEEEDVRHTGGNYDRYVEKKYHVYSKDAYIANTDSTFSTYAKKDMDHSTDAKYDVKAKKDITIESDSKITLKVGGSKITIEDGKIKIEATQIEIKGTGQTSIDGKPVKINGGSMSVPPIVIN